MILHKKMKDEDLDQVVGGLYSAFVNKKIYEKEEKEIPKRIDKVENRKNSE